MTQLKIMIMPLQANLLWKTFMKSEANNICLTRNIQMKIHHNSLLLKSLGDILKSQHQLHVGSKQRKVRWMWRSVSLRGNHSSELMNKDELAFLRIHHRSCISRAHLSEHKRSWNAHNGPALPSIKTNEMGEGSLWRYHNSLCFETGVGLAFNAILYKWSPC